MTRTETDYTSTRHIEAPPETVFEALTTTEELSRWWVYASGSGLAGGELRFEHRSGPLFIRVDRAERPSLVRWSVLSYDPLPDWVGTAIHFDLTPTETGGTRLEFRHAGLTPQVECFELCSNGWNHYLSLLVALLAESINTD